MAATPQLLTTSDVANLRERLWDAGYRPIGIYNFDSAQTPSPGKAPRGTDWHRRALRVPPEDATAPPDAEALNTGILCNGLRAIDIDIDNPTLAAAVKACAIKRFGPCPMRIRENSPRTLLLYRAADGEPRKRVLAGRLGKVEVLGLGQQFVSHGVHPSGVKLAWTPDAPEQMPRTSLPAVTEADIAAFFVDVGPIIAAQGEVRQYMSGGATQGANGGPSRYGQKGDTFEVFAAINDLPNDGPPDWEAWNRVGMAIWGATGGSAAGRELFHAWSERHPAYDAEETDKRWQHYAQSPPTQLGAGTLIHDARAARAARLRASPAAKPNGHDPAGGPAFEATATAATEVLPPEATPPGGRAPAPLDKDALDNGALEPGAVPNGVLEPPGGGELDDHDDDDEADGIPDDRGFDVDIDDEEAEQPEGVQPLGHARQIFYYYSRAGRQVSALSAEQHRKLAMLSIASYERFWRSSQFVNPDGAVVWDRVADWMMTSCREIGIFDPERLRGRGAWLDRDVPVFHAGDGLIIDGRKRGLSIPGSRFIYESAIPLRVKSQPAMSKEEAHGLYQLCTRIRWVNPKNSYLFSGWLVCAMVCGALPWRPAIWITGASGTGKSWLQTNVMSPLLGRVALQVQSKTTEAGIRQTLGTDSMPVIFDEFEAEDQHAAARVQGVLDLMRQSSSDSSRRILKGSRDQGTAKAYLIRSCFAFASVNTGMRHQADQNRVTILELREPAAQTPESQHDFRLFTRDAARLLTARYADSLLARAVTLLPVIRANIEIWSVAVAGRLGSKRLGDQLGALLAGAYCLHSDREVTPQFAQDWVAQQTWDDEKASDELTDHERMLAYLTGQKHRFTALVERATTNEVTIGRLIEIAFTGSDFLPSRVARDELKEIGILVEDEESFKKGILVATHHPQLERILANSPWAASWSRALMRLPGAIQVRDIKRFGAGRRSRVTFIPLALLDFDSI